jgi:hypothetical protein
MIIYFQVIEMSLNADLSFISQIDEWQIYRRDLQETKEDLHVLDLYIHRGISKVCVTK